MPAIVQDEEMGSPISEADVASETTLKYDNERRDSTAASADSDTESRRSVTFQIKQSESSIMHTEGSDTESTHKAMFQDEKMEPRITDAEELDIESKMTDTFDDDGSSTTTSEDSEGEDNDGGTSRRPSEPPPAYDPLGILNKPKEPPTFEADPVRYVLGIKLPIADSGYCACHFKVSSYATAFYVAFYGAMLIADSYGVMPHIIRALYAHKFQLFFDWEDQYVIHGWTGVLLLISAFVLCVATYRRDRPMLMVWMLVMLVYVLMSLVVWLLGMLLSFAAEGWNMHSTVAISAGMVDVGLEFYMLHMVYSFHRYPGTMPPAYYYYDPRNTERRQFELAQIGYREVNFMGIPIATPIPNWNQDDEQQRPQVTTV